MSNTVAAGTVASRSSMSARPGIRGCYSPAGENDNCRETRRAAHSQDLRLTGGYSHSGWESIRGIDKVLHAQHNMAMGGHELCLRFLRCSQRMACLQQLLSPRGKGSCWNEKGSTPFAANCRYLRALRLTRELPKSSRGKNYPKESWEEGKTGMSWVKRAGVRRS
jgi:hypothetical protein